jgi:hypothetical protein
LFERRKIIHEEEYQSPLSTHLYIQSYLHDLLVVASEKRVVGARVQAKQPAWLPPEVGCAKLNINAAMAKTGHGGAVGVVCRSETGMFLGASKHAEGHGGHRLSDGRQRHG